MSVRTHRRYSVKFKLQLVREYLTGEGSLKGIAGRYDLNHSVRVDWLKKYQRRELAEDEHFANQVHKYEARIASLDARRAGLDGAAW